MGGWLVPACAFLAALLGAASAAAAPPDDDAAPAPEPGTDGAVVAEGSGVPDETGGEEADDGISRFYLPPLPFYQETTETSGFRLFFPIFFQEWDDNARESRLGVLPFYWQYRGPDELHETDVVLGLYWRFRRPERFTDVVGPVYVSRTADGYDVGLPPLFEVGGDAVSNYQVIALYFWRFANEETTFALAPPFYYYSAPRYLRYGVPPLLFGGETGDEGYSIFFPVFWQFYNNATGGSTTVVPPLFVNIDDEGYWTAGLAPALYFGGGPDSAHFTLFPLLHYWQRGESSRFLSPLAWYSSSPEANGWGTLLYHQWDEGSEWFRTLAPVWWAWGDDETGERSDVVLNVYHRSDPISSDTVVFPFWWDFHDLEKNRLFGLFPFFLHDTSLYEERSTTWVFPTFQYSVWPRTGAEAAGWSFNLHPIMYFSETEESAHDVFVPFWFDFRDEESRILSAFLLFWDYETYADNYQFWTLFPLIWHAGDDNSQLTLVLNTLYTSKVNEDGSEGWHFHFIPLFDVGRDRPEDISWSVLYGLVGYERRGEYSRMQLFWLPFDL